MSSEINLSYVLTTFNKSGYIPTVISNLLPNIGPDEELIVTDGLSTDGAEAYLQDLHQKGLISSYLSEKDRGEAHGFNKAFTLARGKLIKIITDDDAFHYPAVKLCKEYMLSHPEVDVMAGNTGSLNIENRHSLCWAEDFHNDFMLWKEGKLKNFFFNGTCLMIRKSSLPLLGLFNTGGLLTDMEYALRITEIANLAWCSGIVSVRILNPLSNNQKYQERAKADSERLCAYYAYKYPWERRKEELKKRSPYRKFRSFLRSLKKKYTNRAPAVLAPEPFQSFPEAHDYCMEWMNRHHLNQNINILRKEP